MNDLLAQASETGTSFDFATQWPILALAIVAVVALHFVLKGIVKILFIISVIALVAGYVTGHLDPVIGQLSDMLPDWFGNGPGY